MAEKNLSSTELLRLLQQGTSYGGGADPRRLLAVILQNPQVLSSLRSRAATEVAPYQTFDPTKVYAPETDINDVFYKYTLRPDKKQREAANSYFGGITQRGIGDSNSEQYNTEFENYLVSQGWDPAEAGNFVQNELEKDRKAYVKSEVSRSKAQMKAFYQQRKKAGLTGRPGAGDVGQYLEAETGLKGLSELPTSLEDIAKTNAAKLASKWKAMGRSEKEIAPMVSQFEKQFVKEAKKQKKTVSQLTPKDVLARLIGGL